MGVTNGQAVNATITNAAFINKNQADTMTFPLALTSNLALSKRDESSAATINALVTTSTVVRITGTVTTINGAVAPTIFTDGSILVISNASGSAVTLNHESGSATAGDRFALPGSTALVIQAGQAASFYYDSTGSRWRASAGSGAGGGLSAWAASFAYTAGAVVTYSSNAYICLTGHTSGATFEGDLANWRLINNPVVAKNCMATGSNFESNTTSGWQLFNTTLTSLIPTGSLTLGSATGLSVAATSTGSLAGTYSLAAGNTASTNISAGGGIVSQAFSIDLQDQAKALTFRFAYKVNANSATNPMNFSGTSSNTWAVYIYDVTNSAWIQPAGVYNLVQSSGVGICSGTWQSPSNMTQFRIAIICINATAAATPAANTFQMYFDEFYCGQQVTVMGAPVTDWQDYTPSFTGFGTVSAVSAKYRRVGDSVEVIGRFTAGTTAATTASISLPSGMSVDTGKLITNNAATLGLFTRAVAAATSYPSTNIGPWVVFHASSTGANVLSIGQQVQASGGGQYSAATGSALLNTGEYGSFEFRVPVTGWSSSVQMSNDTDTRVVAAKYGTSVAGTMGTTAPFRCDTKVFDTHGAVTSGAAWKYTAPVAGFYKITALVAVSTAGDYLYIYKNGSNTNQTIGACTSATALSQPGIIELVAGDYVDIRTSTNQTVVAKTESFISVERLSGPSAIAASETVAASYWLSANQAITANVTTINYDTREFDSHGMVTTGASWVATIPISGTYLFTGIMAASAACNCVLYKNGAAYKFIGSQPSGASASNSATVRLIAGDQISFRGNTSVTVTGAASLTSNPAHIGILRVGN